ncbi:coiled-coil-helix-coiled-coil-helix domain containing 3a isoform X1, partial [Tachysurus ichikawai]
CYEISPVCADLQEQIMKCYRENAGKTLLCSNIASLYMQCVNSAKQVSVSETLPVCF